MIPRFNHFDEPGATLLSNTGPHDVWLGHDADGVAVLRLYDERGAETVRLPAADDRLPITEGWLESCGGPKFVLPATDEKSALIEVEFGGPCEDGWWVAITQGASPDCDICCDEDYIMVTSREFHTRGDVREFMRGLGFAFSGIFETKAAA